MSLDITQLTMTEIIRLQDQLSRELTRRFERPLAVAFTDIVGSTAYFAQHGDEAGRRLQQRHYDFVRDALRDHEGARLVDTAGDGAFMCFPSVNLAGAALIAFHRRAFADNLTQRREQELHVRAAVHWGPVLTDGVEVAGDAVNLCARCTGTALGGELRLTHEAFKELTEPSMRRACQPLVRAKLKGVPRAVDLLRLDWLDRERFPNHVRVVETALRIVLPDQPSVSFGRLAPGEDGAGNDVVLVLPDPVKAKQIGRWHFEIHQRADGLSLRQISEGATEVDGAPVPKGGEAAVRSGTVVKVGRVMTLVFGPGVSDGQAEATLLG